MAADLPCFFAVHGMKQRMGSSFWRCFCIKKGFFWVKKEYGVWVYLYTFLVFRFLFYLLQKPLKQRAITAFHTQGHFDFFTCLLRTFDSDPLRVFLPLSSSIFVASLLLIYSSTARSL